MRQVREVLRLRTAGVGLNEVARRVGVAPSTVRLTLKRLATAGLTWPLPAEMTDSALETVLFAAAGTKQDFDLLRQTLGRLFTLEQNPYLIKFRADNHDVVVFPDGRAMVFGTSDPNAALSLYGKYIGG